MEKKLISLARCSTLSQAEAGRYGIQRQISAARQYAKDHDLEFDEELSFKDLGKSGYKKKALKTRALQVFLDNIQNHTIANPRDYILCVEDMSRFSRRPPLETMAEIKKIVESGMSMLFLSKNKIFTEKNLRELPNFIELVFDSNTAFSESAKKSEYSNHLWDVLRKRAAEGKPVHAGCPAWLKPLKNKEGWQVDEPRAEIVRRIYKMYQEGMGVPTIARLLNNQRVPTFGKSAKWSISTVNKILNNHAVYGSWEIRRLQKDESYRPTGEMIEGYFPVVVDKETFMLCRQMAKEKSWKKGKSAGRQGEKIRNLFTHVLRCVHCGGPVYIRGSSKDPDRYTYQVCGSNYQAQGCAINAWVNSQMLEKRILWFLRDEMNIDDLLDDYHQKGDKALEVQNVLRKYEASLNETSEQIEGWLFATGKSQNKAIVDRLLKMIEEAEARKLEYQAKVDSLRAELINLTNLNARSQVTITDVKKLIGYMEQCKGAQELRELRVKLKARISRIVEAIYVHLETQSMAILFKNSNRMRFLYTGQSVGVTMIKTLIAEDALFTELDEPTRKALGLVFVSRAERGGASEDELRKSLITRLNPTAWLQDLELKSQPKVLKDS